MEHRVERVEVDGFAGVALECPETRVRAVVHPELAMLTSSLTFRGEEVLGQRKGLRAYAEKGSTMGIPLLHPWANRLGGADYEVGGRVVRLDPASDLLHLDPNGLPIHGLRLAGAGWVEREPGADATGAEAGASLDFGAHPRLLEAFPFPHTIVVRARLDASTLEIEVELAATGDVQVPVAFGFHPYLTPGGPRAEWEIETPVVRRADLDDHGIPTGTDHDVTPVRGPLGNRTFDDLYTVLTDPPIFSASGGGRRLAVEFREGFHAAQIFAPPDDDVVCFEPMTALTNALRDGRGDLRTVTPGGAVHARFALRVE